MSDLVKRLREEMKHGNKFSVAALLLSSSDTILQALEDAERYRWLRENINIGSSASNLDRWSIDLPDPCKEIDVSSVFDAAIDEARKDSK